LLLASCFLIVSSLGKAGSFQPRVQIQEAVQVKGETISLSDLLPADAPGDLAQICHQVILGDSPLIASQRLISRNEIEQQLRDFPYLSKQLQIPERVIVTHERRRLSSAEIVAAIESFMRGGDSHGSHSLNLKGLDLQAPVFVTQPDPGLEVKRVESDQLERKTRFLLWASNEPQLLPFYVTVKEESRVGRRGFAAPVTSTPIVLVAAGKPARLVIETATLRLTALVTPLESGAKGQIIRVRNQDTQQLLQAEVVGAGLLQATLGGE
jgi:hypothetical protein